MWHNTTSWPSSWWRNSQLLNQSLCAKHNTGFHSPNDCSGNASLHAFGLWGSSDSIGRGSFAAIRANFNTCLPRLGSRLIALMWKKRLSAWLLLNIHYSPIQKVQTRPTRPVATAMVICTCYRKLCYRTFKACANMYMFKCILAYNSLQAYQLCACQISCNWYYKLSSTTTFCRLNPSYCSSTYHMEHH